MEWFTEHRASSCNDAGLWRKLLENAQKGTSTKSYFAADIVEESVQPSMRFAKLGLPAAFLEHHRRNLTENIILEGPDGHKWPVMLGLSLDSKPCLSYGWREFATDCNLATNDQVLFFLWEDSHFLVQVFDSNRNIKHRGGSTSAHIATTTLPQVTEPRGGSTSSHTTRTTLPQVTEPREGSTSSHGARSTLPQVTEPIQSSGVKTTRPNIVSLPSTNNNSGVANNVHKENHTTQASPSGEKLGNQEPGVQDDDDPFADDDESFPDTPDAEEDLGSSMKRARNLNGETKGRGSNWTVYDCLEEYGFSETAEVRKRRKATQGTGEEKDHEKIPERRARQAPTDRSNAVSPSTSRKRARRTEKTSPDDPDSQEPNSRNTLATALAAAKAKAAAKAAEAIKQGEATASAPTPTPATDPVTPVPVEAPKQAFKRPQPKTRSRQIFFSKRRPVTQQEREAALVAGQRYAMSSYNRTHVVQLSFPQVYCGNPLAGTVDFAEAMELPLQGLKQVTLYDVTGREWEAVWYGEHPLRTCLDSTGWTRFALEHYLEEGDVCVFELPDPRVANIAVKVFPVVPLTEAPNPSGWRNHYSVDRPVVPAVVQPEADVGLDQATLGQSSSFGKEDSGMEGKRRRLNIDINLGEEEMNKSGEKDKSSEEDKSGEKDKSSEKGKSCMEERRTEGKSDEKSVEERRFEEKFCMVGKSRGEQSLRGGSSGGGSSGGSRILT